MLDADDPLVQMKITQVVCAVLSVGLTVVRLWIRRHKYWWDDGCAFIGLLTTLLQTAAVLMRVHDPDAMSQLNRVAAYYLVSACFYCIVWLARLSILFSVIRVEPNDIRRNRLYVVAGCFVITWALLLFQIFFVCEREQGWKELPTPQCRPGRGVAIAQLITDVIADSILLAAPLQLLKGLQDKALLRKLQIIFSTCIATTIVSLVHAYYILEQEGTNVVISGLVENGVSLMVCSVPVAAATILRAQKRWLSSEHDEGRTRMSTLRFDHSSQSQSQSQSHSRAPQGIKISTVTWHDVDSDSFVEAATSKSLNADKGESSPVTPKSTGDDLFLNMPRK